MASGNKINEETHRFIEKIIDPAVMTFSEYYNLVNPSGKFHDSDAYDSELSTLPHLNSGTYGNRSTYTELVQRKKVNGVVFEIRLKKKDKWDTNLHYTKTDKDGNVMYGADGLALYCSPEEVRKLVPNRWDYDLAVFDTENNLMVAWITDNEWGCILVVVTREYRGFGFGVLLTKMLREIKPAHPSGGFTPQGYANFVKVHREFVRDYLKSGFYSYLIRNGTLTKERVKEIVESAFPKNKETKKPSQFKNLKSNDPSDWLLYAQDGAFILYDKKLKDIPESNEEQEIFWQERMVKGYVYPGPWSRPNYLQIKKFGADSEKLKKFMMALALSYAAEEDDWLIIENEDLKYVPEDHEAKQINNHETAIKIKGKPIRYQAMTHAEKFFRKGFDQHNEFHHRILELAEGKYPYDGEN